DAVRRGGDSLYQAVRPRYPIGGTDILPDSTMTSAPGAGPRAVAAASPVLSEALLASAAVPEMARSYLDALSAGRASNAWGVGGSRTASGKPIVANDMHLTLNTPTLFYLMGLHAPGVDVVGMTIPGSPGVIAGHSGSVAWGFSNATVDDADFFVER